MSMKCKINTTWHLVSFLKTPTTQHKTQGHHVFGQWMSHRFFEIHGAFPTCFFPQKPQKPMDFGSFSGYGEHEHAVAGFFMTCCPSLFTGGEPGPLTTLKASWIVVKTPGPVEYYMVLYGLLVEDLANLFCWFSPNLEGFFYHQLLMDRKKSLSWGHPT